MRLVACIEVNGHDDHRIDLLAHTFGSVGHEIVHIDGSLHLGLNKCRFFSVDIAELAQQFFLFRIIECAVRFGRLDHRGKHEGCGGFLILGGLDCRFGRLVELGVQDCAKAFVILRRRIAHRTGETAQKATRTCRRGQTAEHPARAAAARQTAKQATKAALCRRPLCAAEVFQQTAKATLTQTAALCATAKHPAQHVRQAAALCATATACETAQKAA